MEIIGVPDGGGSKGICFYRWLLRCLISLKLSLFPRRGDGSNGGGLPVHVRTTPAHPSHAPTGPADQCIARKKDGTAVAWGDTGQGGDASSVDLTNVHRVFVDNSRMAAIKTDGTLVLWGHSSDISPDIDSSDIFVDFAMNGYQKIAVKTDGTAVAWGGYSASMMANVNFTNLAKVTCGDRACATLQRDGTAQLFGDVNWSPNPATVTNVASVQCGHLACVAVKNDGTVATFRSHGPAFDLSSLDLTNVVEAMCGRGQQCVARKSDGTAVTWGTANSGGDSSSVDLTNVKRAVCGYTMCVALKNDGTAVSWGHGATPSIRLRRITAAPCLVEKHLCGRTLGARDSPNYRSSCFPSHRGNARGRDGGGGRGGRGGLGGRRGGRGGGGGEEDEEEEEERGGDEGG